MKFSSAQAVCFSRKPKQTHCLSHHKAWYLSAPMMSLMAVQVSIIFMYRPDLSGSAEGGTGLTQETVVWGWNVECQWRRALVSLPAAFVEVWRVWNCFAVAYRRIRDSGRLDIYTAIHNFSQHLLSKLQVLLFMVMFDITLSSVNWYILHKFTGGL
jgi:hypothetical protein